MVNDKYDGTKISPKIEGGQIRVTKEYGQTLGLSEADESYLFGKLQSRSYCPPMYWFKDTPEVRKILRVAEQ